MKNKQLLIGGLIITVTAVGGYFAKRWINAKRAASELEMTEYIETN